MQFHRTIDDGLDITSPNDPIFSTGKSARVLFRLATMDDPAITSEKKEKKESPEEKIEKKREPENTKRGRPKEDRSTNLAQ